MTTRQPKVHTQLGRAAVRIFAANDRMNQVLIEHLDPAAWTAKPPGKARTIAAIFTHMHNVRCKWVRLYRSASESSSTAQPRALHAAAGPCGIGRERRSLRGDARVKPSAVVKAASRSFTETAGVSLGRLAWKCSATCFLTKPTIAGRCVCSRISSDSHCRKRWATGSGIGKSCGKSAGRLADLVTILRESRTGTRRLEMGFHDGDIEPQNCPVLASGRLERGTLRLFLLLWNPQSSESASPLR